jgi:hypothetical protein
MANKFELHNQVARAAWSLWAAPERASTQFNKHFSGHVCMPREFTAAIIAYVSLDAPHSERVDFAINCLVAQVSLRNGIEVLLAEPQAQRHPYNVDYVSEMRSPEKTLYRRAMKDALRCVFGEEDRFFAIDLTEGSQQ